MGFPLLVLKMEVIDLDLQGLAIVSTQETAFIVALVYWSRPAKGCYTSQTCSCFVFVIDVFVYLQREGSMLNSHITSRFSVSLVNYAWCNQKETFSMLLALCGGNSPVTGEFPLPMPLTRSLNIFSDLRLHKRLSKQSRHRWFETPSHWLWRNWNVIIWVHSKILSNECLLITLTTRVEHFCTLNMTSRMCLDTFKNMLKC